MKFLKKLTKKTFIAILALVVIGVPLFYLTILNSKEAKAAWLASRELWRSGYDDNWAYRKAITVTITSS